MRKANIQHVFRIVKSDILAALVFLQAAFGLMEAVFPRLFGMATRPGVVFGFAPVVVVVCVLIFLVKCFHLLLL